MKFKIVRTENYRYHIYRRFMFIWWRIDLHDYFNIGPAESGIKQYIKKVTKKNNGVLCETEIHYAGHGRNNSE